MVYFGKIRQGKLELDGPGSLPEGMRVRIEPVEDDPIFHLGDDAADDPALPTDLASEHDHYGYGTPRRGEKA